MNRATIGVTVVEMAGGRPALLIEIEPDLGIGSLVVDPLGDACVAHDSVSWERTVTQPRDLVSDES